METDPKLLEAMKIAEANEDRLTDLRLLDRLEAMKRRCHGLEAAMRVITVDDDSPIESGVAQLATDIADEMERLAEEWETERQLRMAEGEST